MADSRLSKERPLRVVQVISVISDSYGGPSTVAIDLNVALHHAGIHAALLTSDRCRSGGSMSAPEIAAVHELTDGRARIFRATSPAGLQNSWGLLHAIWNASRTADLIHIDGQYMLPHIVAYLSARAHKVQFGMQPHGTTERYQRRESARRKAIYHRIVGRRMIRDAAYVLFTSQTEADESADLVRDSQVRVAPLGISQLPPNPVLSVREFLNDAPRSSVVLYLGRLARKKRPELLIDAWATVFKTHPDAKLVMAGPNDDWTEAVLTERAASLGLSERVLLAGPVTRNEATWLYQRSGIFALPSENENFALTVGEALMAGCHVITTKHVSASSYVEDSGQGEILERLAEPDLAGALMTALSHEHDSRSGPNASIKDAFSWDQTVGVLSRQALQSRAESRTRVAN